MGDSLVNVELQSQNQKVTLKNQRLSIITLLLALLSSLLLGFLARKRLKSLAEKNTDLLYQNEELSEINNNLQRRLQVNDSLELDSLL